MYMCSRCGDAFERWEVKSSRGANQSGCLDLSEQRLHFDSPRCSTTRSRRTTESNIVQNWSWKCSNTTHTPVQRVRALCGESQQSKGAIGAAMVERTLTTLASPDARLYSCPANALSPRSLYKRHPAFDFGRGYDQDQITLASRGDRSNGQ